MEGDSTPVGSSSANLSNRYVFLHDLSLSKLHFFKHELSQPIEFVSAHSPKQISLYNPTAGRYGSREARATFISESWSILASDATG